MPVYNCSSHIQDCIKSILLQTYPNWELIIVDDGSTDNTIDLILKFSDKRIKLIKNQNNIGLAASLNKCIDIAAGEFIARMDGDDIMTINRLEIQFKFLTQNTDLDVIGGLAYLIDGNNEILGYKKCLNPKNYKELLIKQGFFIHPSIMGRKAWFHKFRYNPNFKRGEDLELWIRSYNSSNFANINHYMIFYREIGNDYKEKYFKVYLDLKSIIKIHKKHIPYYLRGFLKSRSLLKYLFFDFLKYFGLIQKKQRLPSSELKQIQNILNNILK